MDVDIIVIDQRFPSSSPEVRAVLEDIKTSLRNFACIKSCLPEDPFAVSIIVINHEQATVILKPQRFNLISFHLAVDRIEFARMEEPEPSVAIETALEHCITLLQQVNKHPVGTQRVRITCLSSWCLARSEKNTDILKRLADENAYTNFHRIIFPVWLYQEEMNDNFVNFVLLTSDSPNCTLARIEADKFAFQHLMKSWVNPSHSDGFAVELIFSPTEKLACKFIRPIFDCTIPSIKLCPCHGKKILPTCPTSGELLQPDKVGIALQINQIIRTCARPEPGLVQFQVINRFPIDSIRDSSLVGMPYQLVATPPDGQEFSALRALLFDSNEALLVTTRSSLVCGRPTFLTHNYVLFPEETKTMLLLKEIVTEEQLGYENIAESIVPHEDILSKIDQMLQKVQITQCNPLYMSNRLYAEVTHAVNSQISPDNGQQLLLLAPDTESVPSQLPAHSPLSSTAPHSPPSSTAPLTPTNPFMPQRQLTSPHDPPSPPSPPSLPSPRSPLPPSSLTIARTTVSKQSVDNTIKESPTNKTSEKGATRKPTAPKPLKNFAKSSVSVKESTRQTTALLLQLQESSTVKPPKKNNSNSTKKNNPTEKPQNNAQSLLPNKPPTKLKKQLLPLRAFPTDS